MVASVEVVEHDVPSSPLKVQQPRCKLQDDFSYEARASITPSSVCNDGPCALFNLGGRKKVAVKLRISDAHLFICHSNDGRLLREIVLVPSSCLISQGCDRFLLSAWPPPDVELVALDINEADSFALVLQETVGRVIRSLWSPVEDIYVASDAQTTSAHRNDAGRLACALVVWTPPPPANSFASPVYHLRYAELRQPIAGLSLRELRIYADRSCSDTIEIIALGQCSTVTIDDGSHSVMIKERATHRIAFLDSHVASLWAVLLQGNETKAEITDLNGIICNVKLANKCAIEKCSTSGPPFLQRVFECIDQRSSGSSSFAEDESSPNKSTAIEEVCLATRPEINQIPGSSCDEGFDVGQFLMMQMAAERSIDSSLDGLPQPTDTCHIEPRETRMKLLIESFS